MTEQEVYQRIQPLLERSTEGVFWDFKKTLHDYNGIIKDILAFSNSSYEGDSYIIIGVSEVNESNHPKKYRIPLSTNDRRRLNTDAKYIYYPGRWNIHGLSEKDIAKMRQFSATMSEIISNSMLISQPKCEFVPVRIKKSRWLYVIIVKKVPGVFISCKDISDSQGKIVVKQGVMYIRIADTTVGAKTEVASATEHIRIWKKYIAWLANMEEDGNGQVG